MKYAYSLLTAFFVLISVDSQAAKFCANDALLFAGLNGRASIPSQQQFDSATEGARQGCTLSLAYLRLEVGRTSEAVQLYRDALADANHNAFEPECLYSLGTAYLQLKQYEEAYTNLELATDFWAITGNVFVEAHEALGDLYFETNRLQNAIESYNTALDNYSGKENKSLVALIIKKAKTRAKMEDAHGAAADYIAAARAIAYPGNASSSEIVERESQRTELYFQAAFLKFSVKHYLEAREIYERGFALIAEFDLNLSSERNARNVYATAQEAYNNDRLYENIVTANQLSQSGRYEDAIAMLEVTLADFADTDAERSDLHHRIGIARYNLGVNAYNEGIVGRGNRAQLDEAVRQLTLAIESFNRAGTDDSARLAREAEDLRRRAER